MEQGAIIECWSCRIAHPGQVKCDVCGGRGTIRREARMGDATVSHELLREALDRTTRGSPLERRDALIEALIRWQLYGVGYIGVEHRVLPDSDEFKRAHIALRDRLVKAIRRAERDV
jgi:hypothetical protein